MKQTFIIFVIMIMHGFTLKAQNKDLDSMLKNEEVFDFVEQEAQFPRGEDSMIKFIVNNIKYPAEARHYNIQGKVICSFTVKKDGEVVNAKIVRGLEGGCNEQAIKVIQSMPRWVPGKINGQPVNSRCSIPIQFLIEKDPNIVDPPSKRKRK